MLPPRSQAQYNVPDDNNIYTATCLTKQSPLELFQNVFGLKEFKPGQEEAINAILSGRDSIVLIPTGGGMLRPPLDNYYWYRCSCVPLIDHVNG